MFCPHLRCVSHDICQPQQHDSTVCQRQCGLSVIPERCTLLFALLFIFKAETLCWVSLRVLQDHNGSLFTGWCRTVRHKTTCCITDCAVSGCSDTAVCCLSSDDHSPVCQVLWCLSAPLKQHSCAALCLQIENTPACRLTTEHISS